jgi:hypothetical protein
VAQDFPPHSCLSVLVKYFPFKIPARTPEYHKYGMKQKPKWIRMINRPGVENLLLLQIKRRAYGPEMDAAYTQRWKQQCFHIVSTAPNNSYIYNGAVFKKQKRIKEESAAF